MGMGDVCRVQADLVENCHQTFENVCGSSHRKIWRYMDEQNIPLALVMEDDALGTVSPEFCGYMNYLRNLMSSRSIWLTLMGPHEAFGCLLKVWWKRFESPGHVISSGGLVRLASVSAPPRRVI